MLIDISHYQGNVNFALTNNSVEGYYIKTTEGTSYVDGSWIGYHDAIVRTNRPVGAYHFASLGDPVAEANHFANEYVTRAWQLRPVLDIEVPGSNAAWIVAFRRQFRARIGSNAFRVYSGEGYLTGSLDPRNWIDAETDIWAARYNNTLGWDHPQLVIWQYSSTAFVPGIVGNVDVDSYMHGWTPAADQGADMPLTDADLNNIAVRVWNWGLRGANPGPGDRAWVMASQTRDALMNPRPSTVTGSTAQLTPMDAAMNADGYGYELRATSKTGGIDVKALAAEIVTAITPHIAGIDPAVLADAVSAAVRNLSFKAV